MEDQSRTSDEQVKDFVGETIEVKLKNGLTVSVTTPTLGWWFDFLIPKQKEMQWSNVPDNIQQRIIKDLKKGNISPELLGKMPTSIVEILLEIVVYYIKKDPKWCKENLDIGDFLAILNAFIKVLDPKRVMDFFVQISQQVPVLALAGIVKGV